MHTNDQTRLEGAASTYGVPMPKTITAAGKLATAADRLVADVEAETAPDPESIATAGDLKPALEAMTAWTTHDARQAAARTLVAVAHQRLSAAWDAAVPDFLEAFRRPFDDAAAAFMQALDLAGGSYANASGAQRDQLDQLAAPLTELAAVRDTLGARMPVDLGNTALTRITRILRFTDLERAMRLNAATEGTDPGTTGWWAAVTNARGTVIRWNTPAEQQRQHELARVRV